MNLLAKLRKNNGQFEFGDFLDHTHSYENALTSLSKNNEYELLYKTLKCYIEHYKKAINAEKIQHYRPGDYYAISYYAMLLYSKIMEKGIRGVVKKDKLESTGAYLELLKRYDLMPAFYKQFLHNKLHLLLKHAYPDMMDRYSNALYAVGEHFYRNKDYKKAFKFFKKGADFDCYGRQIIYPYYLIGKNQNMVADMYRFGLGIKRNNRKAIEYYRKCASNCGREEHPKTGDFYLKNHQYARAFLAYTEFNENWPCRYSLYFLRPKQLYKKIAIIFNELNKKQRKTNLDKNVLAMMYKKGFGCNKDLDKAKKLMPNEPKWVRKWLDNLDLF